MVLGRRSVVILQINCVCESRIGLSAEVGDASRRDQEV